MAENNDNIRTLTRGENIFQLLKAMEKEALLLDKTFHLLWHGVLGNDLNLDFFKELYTFKKNSTFYEILCRCYGIIQLDERRMNIPLGKIFMQILYGYAEKYDIGGFQYAIKSKNQFRERYPAEMETVALEMESPFLSSLESLNYPEQPESSPWEFYAGTVSNLKYPAQYEKFWKDVLLSFKAKFSRMPEVRDGAQKYYDTENDRMVPIVSRLTKPLVDLSEYEPIFKG